MACSIDGCDSPARTAGLCQKHYMRLRRNGDAKTVKKAGRPNDPTVAHVAQACSRMSRATKMKVVAAMKLIESIGFDDGVESEVFAELLKRNTRANGSVNVSALHREAIALADSYFADQILGSVSRETDD